MINNIYDFRQRIESLDSIHDAYYVFEEEITDRLRDLIYEIADEGSSEPFRSAMHNLGFTDY